MTVALRNRSGMVLVVLLCAAALAGCGRSQPRLIAPRARAPKPQKLHGPHLWVSIAPDANQNSPIAVDLAAVSDSRLLKMLEQTTVSKWFQQRTQWELDNPGLITVYSWQWVPGQQVTPIPLKLPGGTKAVLVFANYHDPKAQALVLQPGGGGLALRLLAEGVAGYGVK